MTEKDFCYWLRGYFEIADANGVRVTDLTPNQVKVIKAHLELVFVNKTRDIMCHQEEERLTVLGGKRMVQGTC